MLAFVLDRNKWIFVSGQWSVVSSQWSVVSGQYLVVSCQLYILAHNWWTVGLSFSRTLYTYLWLVLILAEPILHY